MILKLLFNVFGPPAFKAVAGAIAAGAGTVAVTAAGACDFTAFGSQIGAAVGAAVIGYIVTWIAPANRPKKV